MRNLTFEQLNTLVELSRWGKQAAAEAALGKSQSQISRDLAAVEEAAGGRLLMDRNTRQPTEAGLQVLEYATQVLRDWERLKDQLAGHGAGQVTLSAVPACVAGAAVPFLTALRQRRPALEVQLLTREDTARVVQQSEADIGLLPGGKRYRGLSQRPWLDGRVLLAVPSNLARHKTITNRVLQQHPVLVPTEQAFLCDVLPQVRNLRIQEIGPGRAAALEAVAGGLGLALLLQFDGSPDPLPRQLPTGVTLRPLAGRKRVLPFAVAIRKNWRPSGAALALTRDLIHCAGKGRQ